MAAGPCGLAPSARPTDVWSLDSLNHQIDPLVVLVFDPLVHVFDPFVVRLFDPLVVHPIDSWSSHWSLPVRLIHCCLILFRQINPRPSDWSLPARSIPCRLNDPCTSDWSWTVRLILAHLIDPLPIRLILDGCHLMSNARQNGDLLESINIDLMAGMSIEENDKEEVPGLMRMLGRIILQTVRSPSRPFASHTWKCCRDTSKSAPNTWRKEECARKSSAMRIYHLKKLLKPSDPANYRQSLTYITSKLLEYIIQSQSWTHLVCHSLLLNLQHASKTNIRVRCN